MAARADGVIPRAQTTTESLILDVYFAQWFFGQRRSRLSTRPRLAFSFIPVHQPPSNGKTGITRDSYHFRLCADSAKGRNKGRSTAGTLGIRGSVAGIHPRAIIIICAIYCAATPRGPAPSKHCLALRGQKQKSFIPTLASCVHQSKNAYLREDMSRSSFLCGPHEHSGGFLRSRLSSSLA